MRYIEKARHKDKNQPLQMIKTPIADAIFLKGISAMKYLHSQKHVGVIIVIQFASKR
ncbi:MAG: hypothetical protein K8R11_09730 [Methanococcoides sp.]|nr:hypothetical protein [Methanococcoides sp.]